MLTSRGLASGIRYIHYTFLDEARRLSMGRPAWSMGFTLMHMFAGVSSGDRRQPLCYIQVLNVRYLSAEFSRNEVQRRRHGCMIAGRRRWAGRTTKPALLKLDGTSNPSVHFLNVPSLRSLTMAPSAVYALEVLRLQVNGVKMETGYCQDVKSQHPPGVASDTANCSFHVAAAEHRTCSSLAKACDRVLCTSACHWHVLHAQALSHSEASDSFCARKQVGA